MKSERGIFLIEALVVLALLVIITAFVGINAQEIIQSGNEKNAESGISALAVAENNYTSSFNGYVTGTNLHVLSDCPAPALVVGKMVVTPTKTAACENISAAYTNNLSAYHYTFNVVPTLGPDGVAGTSDDGYLITATPINAPSGRLTLCESNSDGLLRGAIHAAAPTDVPSCNAFNVIASGPTSTPQQSQLPVTALSQSVGPTLLASTIGHPGYNAGVAVVINTVTVPPGTYLFSAEAYESPNPNGTNNATIPCVLFDSGSTTLASGAIYSTSLSAVTNAGLSLRARATYAAGTTVSLQCTGQGTQPPTTTTPPVPNLILSSSLTAVESQ